MSPKRISVLVVDDIPLMRTMLGKFVQALAERVFDVTDTGIEVEIFEACNGKVALESLQTQPVDLIFLDLMMPEMDGLTFLEVKSRDPYLAPIPTIVCTALDDPKTIEAAHSFGAHGYVTKPFTLRGVEEKLRAAAELLTHV